MSRRTKVIAVTLLALTLLVSWPVAAHYRARGKVQDYKRQLQARGEKLMIDELVPPPPAYDSNGAAALMAAASQLQWSSLDSNSPPSMKYIGPGRAMVAWQQEILPTADSTDIWPGLRKTLAEEEQELAAIRAALERPVVAFDLNYAHGFSLLLPHLAQLKGAAQWLWAATLLDLHEGRSTNAWNDLKALTALVEWWKDERLLISELVRVAIGAIAVNATWEALQSSQWRDDQLRELQGAWESIAWWSQAESGLAMERAMSEKTMVEWRESYSAFGNSGFGAGTGSSALAELGQLRKEAFDNPRQVLRSIVSRYPGYWSWKWWFSYDDELLNLQVLQAAIETARTARNGAALAPILRDFSQQANAFRRAHPKAGHWPVFLIGRDQNVERFLSRVAAIEIQRSLLITAIGLKRYHLGHGAYPAELAALTPEFLRQLPRDPMDGKPLRYRLKPDGSFLLYSVGENGVDDGGDPDPPQTEHSKAWWKGRDAVWPWPATREEVKADFEKLAVDRQAALDQTSKQERKLRERYGVAESGGAQINPSTNQSVK